ncbi:hypothetical protein EDB92DRAFT_849807 [Lactarius akahatsu]|uniref:Uncharacterized protein n=1 Tax=Lactarius akahatsu TaxID=416441 RepID=A0AAD4Q9X2_9AGAM|nr:hypothetical protein EDB92DRAFT_849807 [Lactarius akahatsu]
MAHGRREHQKDDRYNGETNPRSADASQYHHSESEHVEVPPQSMPPPPSHYFGYPPWSAPPPHPSFQEPWCAVPGADDSAPGYGAWHEARHNYPPVPAMSAASRYTDQGAGSAVGVIPYHWDNGNPTGVACVYAPPLASNAQRYDTAGLTPATNVHFVARPDSTDAPLHAPGINAPVSSESLMSLARSLILDLGTRVKVLNVEASGRGGFRVTITLETADTV